MDMDRHIWKGKGLVDYCDSEDGVNSSGSLNENSGFDIYSYDGANECDDEVNAKTSDDEIGSEDLVPTTDDHGEVRLQELSSFTHSDIMAMEFSTLDEGESFYTAYAKEMGFSVRKRSLQKNVRVMVCQKQGS